METAQQSKRERFFLNSLSDMRWTPGLGLLLQRDKMFFTPAAIKVPALRERELMEMREVSVDAVGEHAWPQDRSALHRSSSPQRRPPDALFLRAFLDRSHVVSSGENHSLGLPPPPPTATV